MSFPATPSSTAAAASHQDLGPTLSGGHRPDPAGVGRSTRRRVVAASFIGNFVEWFDYAVYGYLSVTISTVFFPQSDPKTALLLATSVTASVDASPSAGRSSSCPSPPSASPSSRRTSPWVSGHRCCCCSFVSSRASRPPASMPAPPPSSSSTPPPTVGVCSPLSCPLRQQPASCSAPSPPSAPPTPAVRCSSYAHDR